MVQLKVRRNAQGRIYRLSAKGHTRFAPQGSDIVCAGVSAIMQTVILGLDKVARALPEVRLQKGNVLIAVRPSRLAPPVREKVDVIFETALLGLEELDRSYPGFIRIEKG
jgi:uncharacterized protein YsxB (DUF464 family)